jgi:hypothetical protein
VPPCANRDPDDRHSAAVVAGKSRVLAMAHGMHFSRRAMRKVSRVWWVALLAAATLFSCDLVPHPLPPDSLAGSSSGGDAGTAFSGDDNGSSSGTGFGSSSGGFEAVDAGVVSDASGPGDVSVEADGGLADAMPGDSGADSGGSDGGPFDGSVPDGGSPSDEGAADATADAR